MSEEPTPARRRLLCGAATLLTALGSGCLFGPGSGSTGSLEEFLSGANGYEGSPTDRTDAETVTVAVGAGNGLAFAPAAVEVTTGTTVRWTWTGRGGAHNVVSTGDGPLNSGGAVAGDDATYEYTFDEPGTYRYYCGPHRAAGMKAAVVVE